jgi:hypothetical protein
MSVPDQYSLRGGASFQFQKIVFTAGLRYEKVPENDLIGGNKGFRRAATIASVEPGLTYKMKKCVGFCLYRSTILPKHQAKHTE